MTASDESAIINVFFQAILQGRQISMQYYSLRYEHTHEVLAVPLGLFSDRDHWYLVGQKAGGEGEIRTWRADRVAQIKAYQQSAVFPQEFDVRRLLGRHWLQSAMKEWSQRAPVKLRLSSSQAERLRRDWYYEHAHFEPLPGDQVLMTFGENDPGLVLELLRWLGPGAELIEPVAWRALVQEELRQMLASYASGPGEGTFA